jgi:hypothetical protein
MAVLKLARNYHERRFGYTEDLVVSDFVSRTSIIDANAVELD